MDKFVLTTEDDQGGYIWTVFIQKDIWSYEDAHMYKYQTEERAISVSRHFVEQGWYVQCFKTIGYSTHGKETMETMG